MFDRYQRALADYLYRTLEDREDAEEAVSDVFVKAWRGAAGFRGTSSVRNWLYRIALHVAVDRLRSRRRAPGLESLSEIHDRDPRLISEREVDPEITLLSGYQRDRDRRALHLALWKLGLRDRALLALHYFEGCSYERIGEITGQPPARIKGRLHRARQRLKRHFVALRDSDEPLELSEERDNDPTRDPNGLLAFVTVHEGRNRWPPPRIAAV